MQFESRCGDDVTVKQWTALLRLMSLMVIVDSRVREEEVRVFAFRMMELRRRLAPEMMMSEGLVRDWFEAHRDDIAAHTEEMRNAFIAETVETLEATGLGERLVDALVAVAKADGHRHRSELELLARVADVLGVALPRKFRLPDST